MSGGSSRHRMVWNGVSAELCSRLRSPKSQRLKHVGRLLQNCHPLSIPITDAYRTLQQPTHCTFGPASKVGANCRNEASSPQPKAHLVGWPEWIEGARSGAGWRAVGSLQEPYLMVRSVEQGQRQTFSVLCRSRSASRAATNQCRPSSWPAAASQTIIDAHTSCRGAHP